MKRALIIGLTGCAFALAPTIAASAMPVATPSALGRTDEVTGMGMGGAITAVAATTTVGTAATTTAGAIITMGGDSHGGHGKPARA
jgi:hypothetical protein